MNINIWHTKPMRFFISDIPPSLIHKFILNITHISLLSVLTYIFNYFSFHTCMYLSPTLYLVVRIKSSSTKLTNVAKCLSYSFIVKISFCIYVQFYKPILLFEIFLGEVHLVKDIHDQILRKSIVHVE